MAARFGIGEVPPTARIVQILCWVVLRVVPWNVPLGDNVGIRRDDRIRQVCLAKRENPLSIESDRTFGTRPGPDLRRWKPQTPGNRLRYVELKRHKRLSSRERLSLGSWFTPEAVGLSPRKARARVERHTPLAQFQPLRHQILHPPGDHQRLGHCAQGREVERFATIDDGP